MVSQDMPSDTTVTGVYKGWSFYSVLIGSSLKKMLIFGTFSAATVFTILIAIMAEPF